MLAIRSLSKPALLAWGWRGILESTIVRGMRREEDAKLDMKERLIELLEWTLAELRTFYQRLPEDAKRREGLPDRWSPKDQFGHVAGWIRRLAEQLADAQAGREAKDYSDYEAVNARESDELRRLPWDELQVMAEEACQALVAQVAARPEAELLGCTTFAWQEDRPLWQMVVGYSLVHGLAHHLLPVYFQVGDREYGIALAERTAERLTALDEDPRWRGTARYNLGCAYALAGRSDSAVSALQEAITLNPALIPWSKEDPDLNSVRDHPALEAF